MFDFLNEKRRLIKSIRSGDIALFSEIPIELVDLDVIGSWLDKPGNYFNQIPDSILTMFKNLKMLAIEINPENINFMGACEQSEFDNLMLVALRRTSDPFSFVDLKLVSPSVLSRYASGVPRHVECFLSVRAWSDESERAQYIDEFASLNSHNIHLVDLSCVSDDSILSAYKGGRPPYSFYEVIEMCGRLDIFRKAAESGYWPATSERPSSLRNAVARIMCCKDFEEYYILGGFIQSHPVKDACRYMAKNPRRLKLLMELFSSEQLMPHLADNQAAKSKILKNDMGL